MRIDSHQHYWRISRGDYGWITPALPVLYRDFMPDDLEPLLKQHELDGSILVQAAPTAEETEFILSVAERHSSVLGVVGWLDLFDPGHRVQYEKYRQNPKFAGFRLMIQDMPDASRILEPDFLEALRGYAAEKVPVDLLVVSSQLESVLLMLRQIPELHAVIDHIAKPDIKKAEIEPWFTYMEEISRFPNIYCKLSGMVTEADAKAWKLEDFTPYIKRVLELFGPERVMFGSDWPVCLLAAEYESVVEIVLRSLPDNWDEQVQARLFGLNAKEFYQL